MNLTLAIVSLQDVVFNIGFLIIHIAVGIEHEVKMINKIQLSRKA